MSDKLSALLSYEEKAREAVEEATKEARRIRTAIPADVSRIEKEYKAELLEFEKRGLQKINSEIDALKKEQQEILEKRKTALESKSSKLSPRALELIYAAVKGEQG